MAIYSLSASSIGRSTHAAGTAGAHVSYIGRSSAALDVIGAHMPLAPKMARAWLDQQEAADRKNARVVTKVTLALPVELSQDQRAELVRSFAIEVTGGRAPWLAAIHRPSDDGDQRNHHAHLVIRDRDPHTGKACCGMSDRGSVERMREAWERQVNAALARAGQEVRVDRRSLVDQGVDRDPTVHVGVAGTAMQRAGRVSDRAEINSNIIEFNSDLAARRQVQREVAALEHELEAAKAKRVAEYEAGFQRFRAQREAERQLEREKWAAEAAEREKERQKAARAAQEARERQRLAAEAAEREKAARAAQEARERQRLAAEAAEREKAARAAQERAARQLVESRRPVEADPLAQVAKAAAQRQDAADFEAIRLKAKTVIERFVDENPRLRSKTPDYIRISFNRDDLKPFSPASTAAARIVRFVMTDDENRQLAEYLRQKPSIFVRVQLTKIWEMLDLATSAKELKRVADLVLTALSETVRALAGRDTPGQQKGRDQGGMER